MRDAGSGPRLRIWDAGRTMRDAGGRIRDAGGWVRDVGCRMQAEGCGMSTASRCYGDSGWSSAGGSLGLPEHPPDTGPGGGGQHCGTQRGEDESRGLLRLQGNTSVLVPPPQHPKPLGADRTAESQECPTPLSWWWVLLEPPPTGLPTGCPHPARCWGAPAARPTVLCHAAAGQDWLGHLAAGHPRQYMAPNSLDEAEGN